jgi:hypothetical protein
MVNFANSREVGQVGHLGHFFTIAVFGGMAADSFWTIVRVCKTGKRNAIH